MRKNYQTIKQLTLILTAIIAMSYAHTLYAANDVTPLALPSPVQNLSILKIKQSNHSPALSINGVLVTEGNANNLVAQFTITLSNSSTTPVSVDYFIEATPGGMELLSGTLNFAPGETRKMIEVTISDDLIINNDASFTLTLLNASSATIDEDAGTTTVVADDIAPAISMSNQFIAEGHVGITEAQVSVNLSKASSEVIRVNFQSNNLTAIAPTDYTASSGTLTFNPGETQKTFVVLINGDITPEMNETVSLELTNPLNAFLSMASVVLTINNDDLSSDCC